MGKMWRKILAQERALMPKALRSWAVEAEMLLEVERFRTGRPEWA